MSVTVDGIFSGLDTTAIVNALIGVQSGRRAALQQQLERERSLVGALGDVNRRLVSLSETAEKLRDLGDSGYRAVVPEGAGFTATTGDGAISGTYNVNVLSLATSQVQVSQGYASADTSVLPSGTLTVSVNGVDTFVNVDGSNDTLRELAQTLDQIDGVQAYVLDRGGVDPFQLVVQTEATGAANTVTIDTSGLFGGGTTPVFTQAQAGADAQLTINGLPISSASNDVTAIPGLTLGLQQAGLGASTVRVEIDRDRIEELLGEFVDAYNEIVDYVSARDDFDREAEEGGPLFGDSTSRSVVDRLGNLVSRQYATGTSLTILAQLGIATEQLGTLDLDTSALSDAIDRDFDAVVGFLTSETGPLATLISEIEDTFVDTVDGLIKTRTTSLERSIRDLEVRIEDEDARLEAQAQLYRDRFTRLETTLAELQGTTQFISNLFPPTETS